MFIHPSCPVASELLRAAQIGIGENTPLTKFEMQLLIFGYATLLYTESAVTVAASVRIPSAVSRRHKLSRAYAIAWDLNPTARHCLVVII